jgi:3-oxoacyl-(acyl-carrier-protein) synthase
MISSLPCITGIGSVSPYGPRAGAFTPTPLEPSLITAWPTTGERRAYLVPPFRPTDVAPGLKTRRLDRLSVWSLVAAWLAIQDSGLDLNQLDRSRVAVIFGTELGCIELTEAFFRSAASHGWSQTDPILFPETLGNAPAGHIARHFGLRGPNLTVSCKGLAGECALLQGVSLLRNGQADLALVVSGETFTEASYGWYEAAGMLAGEFVPSEGVTALVLQQAEMQQNGNPRFYAGFRAGHSASGTDSAAVVQRVLSQFEARDSRVVVSGRGLLELSLALNRAQAGAQLLYLGTAPQAGFSALLLELPE